MYWNEVLNQILESNTGILTLLVATHGPSAANQEIKSRSTIETLRTSVASSVWDLRQPAKPDSQPSQPAKPAKPVSQAIQPSQPSQPSQASQASQPATQLASHPATVASGHRSLRPPSLDVCKLFYRGIQSLVIRPYRLPQAAKGRQTFWHPQHRGGAANHATNPSNINDIANFPANHVRMGHGTTLGRPFHGFGVPIKML